ncbi:MULTISPECIES: TetR/AcrR family transcriptional regulator [Helcobacillus]|uniref:AcrR family transcriptional regulator n=1 Tax=Helcobacillus massiliensis TaxID=521392 RepID=A0A839QT29_9MICO|nr:MULTISPECIES: TetR family transcriptional regulator [Helcobacillus]MBB3023653.1 AcrR family transcriptional regulator [Helcobacillus massiliensis]MCG7427822.1 TetR family transcriptional regulator [Helcobacillus sp. ACRRO]MDK7741630.1 TetR family transcriptional regulator [Helcobacillus massiliensis]WOO92674.1 TetR family transcriptional regulator [Helcobacillus massiliensis]
MPSQPRPPAQPVSHRGRRAGHSGTREALLDAARDQFADHGYDGASLRAIASQAQVDPGLIRHFFGSKQDLFNAAMEDRALITDRLMAAIAGPQDGIGARAVDAYLRLWEDEDTSPILMSMVRSAMTTDHGADLINEVIVARLAPHTEIGIDSEPARQITLAGAHLLGVAVSRSILKAPPLVEMSHEELVEALAPMVQETADRVIEALSGRDSGV